MSDCDELREHIDYIDQKHADRIDQAIKPRIESLESARDDAREERAELHDLIQDLQQEMAVMKERLDGIAGLADDQATNPEKRVQDLRQAMIRRAEAREERDEFPGVKLYYKEVQDLFADYGHGEISKPDCYKAMRDARDGMAGFEEATKTSADGNEVKAIRLNLEELRAGAASRNPTTSQEGPAAEQPTEHTVQSKSD